MKKIFGIILLVFAIFDVYSQKIPERSEVRKGNKLFNQGKYIDAEAAYSKGLKKNPESTSAKYNLANAVYRQERYDDAAKLYKELAKEKIDSTQPPHTYHNLGNAMLKQAIRDKETQGQHVAANQEQLKESIEAYKKSLKLNPDDMETKSNLSYAQKLLAKNGGGGGGNNNQQDQQNQNQDKNEDNKKNDDENNDNQNKNNDEKQNQDKNEKQPQGMNKHDIDRMLEAVRAQEEKTKEKVDKEKAMAAKKIAPEKNW